MEQVLSEKTYYFKFVHSRGLVSQKIVFRCMYGCLQSKGGILLFLVSAGLADRTVNLNTNGRLLT